MAEQPSDSRDLTDSGRSPLGNIPNRIVLPNWNASLGLTAFGEPAQKLTPPKSPNRKQKVAQEAPPSEVRGNQAGPLAMHTVRRVPTDSSLAHTPARAGARLLHPSTPASILSSAALHYMPNALEADFWLRRAQAMELAGNDNEALSLLMEASTRDVRPATAISRAIHELQAKLSQTAVNTVTGGPLEPLMARSMMTGTPIRTPRRLAISGPASRVATPASHLHRLPREVPRVAFGRSAAVLSASQPAESRSAVLPATPARSYPPGSLSQAPQRMTEGGLRSAMRTELHPTPRQTEPRPRFAHVSFESPAPRMTAAWQLPEAPHHPPATPLSTAVPDCGVDTSNSQDAGKTPYRVSMGSAGRPLKDPDAVPSLELAAQGVSDTHTAALLAPKLTYEAPTTAAVSWTTAAGEREMDIMAKFLSQMLHTAFSSDFPAALPRPPAAVGSSDRLPDVDVDCPEAEVSEYESVAAEEAAATPMHNRVLLGSGLSPSTGAIHLTPGYGLLIDDEPADTARSPSPEDDDVVEMESPRSADGDFRFSPASNGFSFGREMDEELLGGCLTNPMTWGYSAEHRVGGAIDLADGTPSAVHFGGFGSPQGPYSDGGSPPTPAMLPRPPYVTAPLPPYSSTYTSLATPRSVVRREPGTDFIQTDAQAPPSLGRALRMVTPHSFRRERGNELRQLLMDGYLDGEEPLGSYTHLSPVRATFSQRHALGSSRVVTPVRRSSRQPQIPGTSVAAILEETDFSYAPNPVQAPAATTSPANSVVDDVSPTIESLPPVCPPSCATPETLAATTGVTENVSPLELPDAGTAIISIVASGTAEFPEAAAVTDEAAVPPAELQAAGQRITRKSVAASAAASNEQGAAGGRQDAVEETVAVVEIAAAVMVQKVHEVTSAAAAVEPTAGVSTRSSASAASSASTTQVSDSAANGKGTTSQAATGGALATGAAAASGSSAQVESTPRSKPIRRSHRSIAAGVLAQATDDTAEERVSQQTPRPAVLRSSSTNGSTVHQSASHETKMSPTEARIRAGLRRSSRLRRKSLNPDA